MTYNILRKSSTFSEKDQFVTYKGAEDLLFILGVPHSNIKIEEKNKEEKKTKYFAVKRKALNVRPDSSLPLRNCFAIYCTSL